MGEEIDLLSNYPRSARDLTKRAQHKTEAQREIARQFGKDFFDGSRETGYGGFTYDPRFWSPVIPTFIKKYGLTTSTSVLDVGCAKGFMLYDLILAIPGMPIGGIDISDYAISNAKSEVKEFLRVGNATNLPFEDDSFDLVISINTIHNLDEEECVMALKEIQRVSKKYAFITVDAYRDEDEQKRMFDWNLTAKTIKSTDEWVKFFDRAGYSGDYYWFIP